jgi:hypothetical protein
LIDYSVADRVKGLGRLENVVFWRVFPRLGSDLLVVWENQQAPIGPVLLSQSQCPWGIAGEPMLLRLFLLGGMPPADQAFCGAQI